MWKRLAREAASVESTEIRQDVRKQFNEVLKDWKFIPGGRINYALGRTENVSNTNCYVIPIRKTIDHERWMQSVNDNSDFDIADKDKYTIEADSIEGIYNWLKESALTYRATGGVGTDISVLRPKGSEVKNSGGITPGSFSFMDLMSKSTHTVHQKLRRGALMITMNIHHPDILEFIKIKKILGKIKFAENQGEGYNDLYKLVEHANISVLITDEFLQALENGEEYEQRWPVEGKAKIKHKANAKEVWDAVIENAHQHGEPGILFIDNHKKDDALWYCNPCVTTNPCGEQFLGAYGNCLLGHMNLAKYVKNLKDSIEQITEDDWVFDYKSFWDDVRVAVRFLDNCIDWNNGRHALPQQNEVALNERRIGLGITGLGDALIRLQIRYDSAKAREMVELIMAGFRNAAYDASVNLAKEKGAFPWYESKKWMRSKFVERWIDETAYSEKENAALYENGIRNSFLLTVAPVGSGSIIGQVSSGIEPLFATSYTRRVRQQDGSTFKEFKTYPRIIEDLFDNDEDLPEYVVTAHDVNPKSRVKLQAVIQRYIDNSISSTINLAENVTTKTVENVYLDAWKQGLKSLTVYRDRSREGILIPDEPEEEKPKVNKKRPLTLFGPTYKIPVDAERKVYITIGGFEDQPNKPFEIFLNTYGKDDTELKTISVLLSSLLRQVDDPSFIINHLKKIESPKQGTFWHDVEDKRRYFINSVPMAVAIALEKFMNRVEPKEGNGTSEKDTLDHAEQCPKCSDMSYISEEGCNKCMNCGYSKCS